jgi:hypothetical protein
MQLELMRRHGVRARGRLLGRRKRQRVDRRQRRRHPDRFIAFASISPERAAYRPLWQRDDPALLQTLEALLASGRFRGIGEISAVHFPSPGLPEADFDPSGPTMAGILALARATACRCCCTSSGRGCASSRRCSSAFPTSR